MTIKEALEQNLLFIGNQVKLDNQIFTYIGSAVWGIEEEKKHTVYRFVKGEPIIFYMGSNEKITIQDSKDA